MFTKTTPLAWLGLTALFLSLSPSVLAQNEDFSLSRFSEYEHKIPTVDLSKSTGTEDVLDQAFDDAFAGSTVKGMTAALVTSEGTVWERAAGLSEEFPADATLTIDHLHGIASNTKSYVAATVLLMAEDGLLDIDDSMDMYLEPIENTDGSVTIAQLLGMRSGFSDYLNDNPDWVPYLFDEEGTIWEIEDLLSLFMLEPNFDVDQDWGYSNSNYLLAALIMESITGNPWHEEVRNRVLDPLGLTETFVYPFEEPTNEQALSHVWGGNEDGEFVDLTEVIDIPSFFSIATSAGCIISTAEDLAKFRVGLHGGQLLEAASYEEMKQAYSPAGIGIDYGLGIYSDNYFAEENWGHDGSWGYLSLSRYFPECDYALVVIQNEPRTQGVGNNYVNAFLDLKETYDICECGLVSTDEISPVEIDLYPNPSSGVLNVQVDALEVELRVIDLLGNTVIGNLKAGSNSLEMLSNGTYLVVGVVDGEIVREKVLVEK
ncbi:serine hydrolase [Sanyastnella coralliicola]|uniref:serine hydrolase n=1 Tax=Sanyastnella coralliicola TaxID=3069118 RepID=UPI0027B8BF38|nr:serine hydrolase [Longitalea sp. SCSIO 12813]